MFQVIAQSYLSESTVAFSTDNSVSFSVTFSTATVTPPPPPPPPVISILTAPSTALSPLTYVVGDSASSTSFSAFSCLPTACSTSISYSLSVKGYSTLPSYLTLDPISLQITVSTLSTSDSGFYTCTLLATQVSGGVSQTASMPWNLTILNPVFSVPTNTAPQFVSSL